MTETRTVGQALVQGLKQRGVRCVFGIPGVHTIELYRGLDLDGIRHITPRHEQGAGFMADGYARASGQPGVAFVITGPGLTNTLTALAQARADSVPVLTVSAVNERATLGHGLGYLHELPDQQGLMQKVVTSSEQITTAADISPVLARSFAAMTAARPGPAHIEVPLDVAAHSAPAPKPANPATPPPRPNAQTLQEATEQLQAAQRIVIVAGGGMKRGDLALRHLAETLDAPVVLTTNARGLMHGHPLCVPASPSLQPVRQLIAKADCVLALGTELGPTDYDMYGTGKMPQMRQLIRVDLCAQQLTRHPCALKLCADAADTAMALASCLGEKHTQTTAHSSGAEQANACRTAAWAALSPHYQAQVTLLNTMRDALPGAMIVGDSTQPIYAGNLYYDHDCPGGWFNAATGYGALGYAIPAAIGAAIAQPKQPVICLTGDGGAQFSLPELATAVQEQLPIRFVIWNNQGYGEIATSMRAVAAPVIGCDATPPDFAGIAQAYGIPHCRIKASTAALKEVLTDKPPENGAILIEIISEV